MTRSLKYPLISVSMKNGFSNYSNEFCSSLKLNSIKDSWFVSRGFSFQIFRKLTKTDNNVER